MQRFVFVSFSGGICGDDALTVAKRDVEARVRESGMTFTILRPSYFMEVWLGPAPWLRRGERDGEGLRRRR